MAGRKSYRFSRKYSLFLSEASNEEIVAISKELSGVMANQIRSICFMAIALLAVSSMVLLAGIFLISMIDGPVTVFNTVVVFGRFGAVALMCISAGLSAAAVGKALKSSSMSSLMWRNVRETADDETAYEHTSSINKLNHLLYTSRNNLYLSAVMLVAGSIVMGATYAVEMFAAMGYI